jgi:hypothetical protein
MKKTLLSFAIFSVAIASTMMTSCQSSAPKNDIPKALPSKEEMQQPFGNHDERAFINPDRVHYPETWFHYIGGNVSHAGITADLEAIASAGISGVQLFHGQFGGQWPATTEDIQCMSENWDAAVKHTADECEELAGVALLCNGVFAGVYETDFVAQVVHVTLVIINKNNIAMLTLERFIGHINQALGLSAALVAQDYANHFNPLLRY